MYVRVDEKINYLIKKANIINRNKTSIEEVGNRVKELVNKNLANKLFIGKDQLVPVFRDFEYKNNYFSGYISQKFLSDTYLYCTLYHIDELIKLKSKYSCRLYQILSANAKRGGSFVLHLKNFKEIMSIDLEDKYVVREIEKALKEISENTDLTVELNKIKVQKDKRKLSMLHINIVKEEVIYVEKRIEEVEVAIESACRNRFIDERKKKDGIRFRKGIYNLIETYGQEVVIRGLKDLRKNTNVSINNSFQAYLVGTCKNILLLQNEKVTKEKKEPVETKKIVEEVKNLKEVEMKNAMEKFDNLSDMEKEEIEKEAKSLFLLKTDKTHFLKTDEVIYKYCRKQCIFEVLLKRES